MLHQRSCRNSSRWSLSWTNSCRSRVPTGHLGDHARNDQDAPDSIGLRRPLNKLIPQSRIFLTPENQAKPRCARALYLLTQTASPRRLVGAAHLPPGGEKPSHKMQLRCFAQMRKSVPASTSSARVMPGLPPFPAWHTIAQSFALSSITPAHWDFISKALAQHMSPFSQRVRPILRKTCAVRRGRHPLAQGWKLTIRPKISAEDACWTLLILPARNPILVSVRATSLLPLRQNVPIAEDQRSDTMPSAFQYGLRRPIKVNPSMMTVSHEQLIGMDHRSDEGDRHWGPRP